MHFVDLDLVEVVSDRPDAHAWRVDRDAAGKPVETRVEAHRLDT
jgi:YD repeat-containing protein